jgi:hypothetical protein
MLDKLRWYRRRLAVMDAAEVGLRLQRAAQARLEALRAFDPGEAPAPDVSRRGHGWVPGPPPGIDPGPILARAEEVRQGKMQLFGRGEVDLGRPPDWNRDPKTGRAAPLSFGKTLDYRDESLVGDIKYLWEPSRHLGCVHLAQAWAVERDPAWLQELRHLLESWMDQCPCPFGPNWTSALEAAVRLVHWSAAWTLVGGMESSLFEGRAGGVFRGRWLASAYRHMEFVAGWMSFGSSANNHLIGEAAGLLAGCAVWPLWDDVRGWREKACAVLRREIPRQIAPDGVDLELATGYQAFVFDLLVAGKLAGEAQGVELPPDCLERMEAMAGYVASIMDAGGNVPMLGDADDAVLLELGADGADPFRRMLATAAVMFQRPDLAAKAGRLDGQTRWLLRADPERFEALRAEGLEQGRLTPRREFSDAGVYVLGRDLDGPGEARIVADAGPLGLAPLCAHGHADALSFTLSLQGREFLVDPGTYCYHAQRAWRDYFRGTSAHNTVRVDGADQSAPGGSFLWTSQARVLDVVFDRGEGGEVLQARHDGYARLPDPVGHSRRVSLDKMTGRLLVEDEIRCEAGHEAEWFWHFSEDCRVELQEGRAVVENGPLRMVVKIPRAARDVRVARGEENPPLGWVSRRFDAKVPAPALTWRIPVQGTAAFTTVLCWDPAVCFDNDPDEE